MQDKQAGRLLCCVALMRVCLLPPLRCARCLLLARLVRP